MEGPMLAKNGIPTPEMIEEKFPSEEALKNPRPFWNATNASPAIPAPPVVRSGPSSSTTAWCRAAFNPREMHRLRPMRDRLPGLAITVAQIIDDKVLFKIPYEFKPYPQKGEVWHGLNAHGDIICEAEVKNVLVNKLKTALVTVLIDKNTCVTLRPSNPMIDKSNIIICRCEDVTLQQIDDAIDRGYHTYEDLKRLLRIGMGPCQGNTCGH
jgi:bacterioferritin-associated ferredoxin